MQANGHILGLALAGFGGSAARLVNGDGDDLKDRRQRIHQPSRRRQRKKENRLSLTFCMMLL